MNFAMWKKALNVIPEVSKEEWDGLDVISRWLISTRAAVLIMTFISAALAGLFAWRDGSFSFIPWIALVFGLIMAHASNNIFNDYTDFVRGVDKDNYYRTMYGAQPIASGLDDQTPAPDLFRGDWLPRARGGTVPDLHQRQRPDDLDFACFGRILCLVLHLAAQGTWTRRDCRADGLGSADDRRRILCVDPSMELVGCHRQPAVCAGRDDSHLRQAY